MKISKGKKTAIVWGAETKLGKKVVELLLLHDAYIQVKVFVKKKLNFENKKLKQFLFKSENFQLKKKQWEGSDLFLCNLIKAHQSKTKKELYNHNFLLPVQIAKLCKDGKVNQIFCLSTLGANENSPFFNHRLLGSLQNHISKMDYWSVHFFQPFFLFEKKELNPIRKQVVKTLGEVFNNISGGKLSGLKPMPPEVIAKSMVFAAQQLKEGIHFYKNDEFQKIEELHEDFAK